MNSILANSISPDKAEFHNNLISLCTISIITCLDNISSIQKEDRDIKKQTDLILEQVNSTKLKEWINILSSFHTRHTKSDQLIMLLIGLKMNLKPYVKIEFFFRILLKEMIIIHFI